MNERQPHDSGEAIGGDDAERLMAGGVPEPDGSPTLATLHAIFASARMSGGEDELTGSADVVAAFRAARSTIQPVVPRHDTRLKAITRRTIAIIGIATGASLGAAFATGAVGNPFTTPPPPDLGPGTTLHSIEQSVASPTTVAEGASSDTIPGTLPTISTVAGRDPASTEPATTTLPSDVNQAGTQTGETPSATAPGQTGETPSATEPGQTGETPSATAPGQTGETPSATAPGQTRETPSATAPGQTRETPSATAPGRTEETPSATAPGQTREK